MEKTIKEVFKDYNSNSFELNEAKIKTVNVFKKTGRIELILIAEKQIKILDLIAFERYIEKRFGFKETIIKIEYIKLPPFTIIEEWKNIIEYIAYKYPLAKALLMGSIVNVDGNNVNINLALKGKDILETRRFDQIIAETMMNLYNQKCNVKFVEKPLEDIMLHLQEQNKKLEEEYILTIKNQEKESKKEKIEEKKGLDFLKPDLKDMALLRQENPEASLAELSKISGLSRSGVNHRLKKIVEIAKEL